MLTTRNILSKLKSNQFKRLLHTQQKQSLTETFPSRIDAFGVVKAIEDPIHTHACVDGINKIIYRLMSSKEICYNAAIGKMGNSPDSISLMKNHHLNVIEHVQHNNSKLFSSYSYDANAAASYSAISSWFPQFYALVASPLPPVFAVPCTHYSLDPDEFRKEDAFIQAQYDMESQTSDGYMSSSTRPKNTNVYTSLQKEIDMLINTPQNTCDFRPKTNESIIAVYVVWGSGRVLKQWMITDYAPFLNQHHLQRSWAFEVVCPFNQTNYGNMIRNGRDKNIIPHGYRMLTADEAAIVFPEMMDAFPAKFEYKYLPQHVIMFVPDSIEFESPKLTQYIIEQHLFFRKEKNYDLMHVPQYAGDIFADELKHDFEIWSKHNKF